MRTRSQRSLAVALALIGMLALRGAAVAQGWPPGTLVLTDADNGTATNAAVGRAIGVDLRGSEGTGYTWMLAGSIGDSVVTNGPSTWTPDPGGGVGRGGTVSFPFLAAKPGDTTLVFVCRQPWEGGETASTYAVTIRVSAPPRLSIQLVGTNVFLSWPIAASSGFYLEGAMSLAPPQWAALNVLPLPQGTNYTVTLGTGGRALFFRLRP